MEAVFLVTASSRPGFRQISTEPALDHAAKVGGYAWWYAEVHDAEDQFGLTLIVFAGSVFSADYAQRLRRGQPITGLDVPAVNLAVYKRRGPGGPSTQKLWVMNEYGKAALRTDAQLIAVADSQLSVQSDGSLQVQLHEPTTRFFGKPGAVVDLSLRLGPPTQVPAPLVLGHSPRGEAHLWQPFSLLSPAEVELRLPNERICFSGTAYADHNYGSGRLEDCFARWGWAHGFSDDGSCGAVVYDTTALDGQRRRIGLLASGRGALPIVEEFAEPPPPSEPGRDGRDFWWQKVPRAMSAGSLHCTRREHGRLLDAPFYARFGVEFVDEARVPGIKLRGVGEYLDLERFRLPALQFLLRYKTYVARRSDDSQAE